MVIEAMMICNDNSEWMRHSNYSPTPTEFTEESSFSYNSDEEITRLKDLAAHQKQLINTLRAESLHRAALEQKLCEKMTEKLAGMESKFSTALAQIQLQLSNLSNGLGMGELSILGSPPRSHKSTSNFVHTPLPPIDYPRFDGMNPRAWILKCDSYFKLMPNISDAHKVDMASLHFEGKALMWFQTLPLGDLVLSWKQFLELVSSRFELNRRYSFVGEGGFVAETSVGKLESGDEDIKINDSIGADKPSVVVITTAATEKHDDHIEANKSGTDVVEEDVDSGAETAIENRSNEKKLMWIDDEKKRTRISIAKRKEDGEYISNVLVMIQPSLISYAFNSLTAPVLLDVQSIGAVVRKLKELGYVLTSWDPGDLIDVSNQIASDLCVSIWKNMADVGIKYIPGNNFSFYNQVLDTTSMLGAVPSRYGWNGGEIEFNVYFSMAKSNASVHVMEITKWLDTNNHYFAAKMYTIFAAGLCFLDEDSGSLFPDQMDDFVVLTVDSWDDEFETVLMLSYDQRRFDTLCMSEAIVRDALFFLGPMSKDVVKQYASVTGVSALSPLFAIAYHQCRWNYRDEGNVFVDAKFEEYNIYYNVLWLDIEHTDDKEYSTWVKKYRLRVSVPMILTTGITFSSARSRHCTISSFDPRGQGSYQARGIVMYHVDGEEDESSKKKWRKSELLDEESG